MLETEVTNSGALRLYEKLGFAREERLLRYYLNGVDAFRLKLWLRGDEDEEEEALLREEAGAPPPPPPYHDAIDQGLERKELPDDAR